MSFVTTRTADKRPRTFAVWTALGMFAFLSFFNSMSTWGDEAPQPPNWIRGSGELLELRLSGRVKRQDGGTVDNAKVQMRIQYNDQVFETLKPDVHDGHFAAWLPVNSCRWYSLVVDAVCSDGARGTQTITRNQLRERVIHGLELQVKRPSREVKILVQHAGRGVGRATVRATLSGGGKARAMTNKDGVAVLALLPEEELLSLTAWSDQSLTGGFQLSRKPIRDPKAKSFTIDMFECRPYEIHLRDEAGKPIEGVELSMHVATPSPDVNFFGTPDGTKIVTNRHGVGVYPWFPKLKEAYRYAEIFDRRWRVASSESETDKFVVVAKKAVKRQAVSGVVSGGEDAFVGGFSVRLGTFQDEVEQRIDFVYAMTDADGRFSVDVLPDATYCAFVMDEKWVSQPLDFIPYDSDTRQRKSPTLLLSEGIPARIKLTSGSEQKPMANVWVNVDSDHRFSWQEDGRSQSGSLGRNASGYTNSEGILEILAPLGKLEASVYLPDWRASEEIVVQAGKVNEVHLHRKVDEAVAVVGELIPWKDTAEIQGAKVLLGAMDGESGDEFKLEADAEGGFKFETKATKLGVIAYSADKQFAGSAVIKNLKEVATIQLYPTKSYSGQILDQQGQPVASHKVWASIRIEDGRKYGTAYPTTFYAPRIEVQTDEHGKYKLEGLPCKTSVLLGTDTLPRLRNRFRSIDEVFLLPDDDRPSKVTRIGEKKSADSAQAVGERFQAMLRDCRLGDFHLMVILNDPASKASQRFIDKHLLNYAQHKTVSSFMQLRVTASELSDAKNAAFLSRKDWLPVSGDEVFVCAYDAKGQELGHAVIDSSDTESPSTAFEFIERHAPRQQDALQKWEKAFKAARASNQLVWVRTGQRYCGPCFRLSRWLDDHRNVLEKDFIFVKIDNVRDLHGNEVAERMIQGRSVGVPFHAIFDTNEQMVTDSYGPTGNIGYMSGFEGKRHFRKMLDAACSKITKEEIEQLVRSLDD